VLQHVLIPVLGMLSAGPAKRSVVVRVVKDSDEWQCRVVEDFQGRSLGDGVVPETRCAGSSAAEHDTERAGRAITPLLETQPAGSCVNWRVDPDQLQVTVGKQRPAVACSLPDVPGTGVQDEPGRSRKQRINGGRTR